jgi:hypothetical protein
MPDLSPETIYRVFRDLLDEAPASLRPQIESLLARAEAGEKTDNQLLRLARRDPDFLQRVNARLERLEMVDIKRSIFIGGDVSGLIVLGPPISTPGLTYVCPQCDYSRTLGEVGEEPGECPTHQLALIPQAQKER